VPGAEPGIKLCLTNYLGGLAGQGEDNEEAYQSALSIISTQLRHYAEGNPEALPKPVVPLEPLERVAGHFAKEILEVIADTEKSGGMIAYLPKKDSDALLFFDQQIVQEEGEVLPRIIMDGYVLELRGRKLDD
jgi:hypothetical protein